MVDFTGNPYLTDPRFQLSDEQMRQYRLGSLGSALTNFGAGIAQSGASGQPWFAGIAPGAAMASQAMGQESANLAKMQQAAAQYQQMEDYRKAQEEDLRGKAQEREMGAGIDKLILERIKNGGGGFGDFKPPPGPMLGIPGAANGPPVQLQTAGPPIVNYLMSQGLSAPAAAGVAGNLFQESGFNPNAVGDGGKSRGIAQWDPQRYAGLQQFAKAQGGDPGDPKTQLDYMMAEMRGGDMGAQRAYAELQRAKTPQEATAAMMHFERPQGYTPANPQGGHGFAQRAQYAQALMPNAQPMPQGGDQPTGNQPGVMPQPPQQAFNGPPGASAGIDPTTEAMLMSKRFGTLGQARVTNQNQQFTQELERQKFLYQQQQDAEKEGRLSNNADVIRDANGNWVPNTAVIGSKKEISAAQGTDPAGHGLKLLMDQTVKTHGDYQAAAQAARTSAPNLERLNSLLTGLDTGKTKEITTDTKAWLKDFGINLDAFGVLDDTGRAQAAKSLGSQLALTLRNPANGGGLPGSMSNYEDKLLQSMSPSLVQTPEGNRILLDALRKQNQRSVEMGRIANDWMRANGGKNLLNDPAGLYAVIDKYVEAHPLFTEEDAKKMAGGGSAAPASAAPATPAAPSMAPLPSKEELYKKYNLK